MTPERKIALAAGLLYLVTFVSSIPALALKAPLLEDGADVLTAASDGAIRWAGVLEIINALACIGTAVVLYSITRRQSETAALGFVSARVLEAAVIFTGVAALLAIPSLREASGADAAAAAAGPVAAGLAALHEWTFLLGPGLIPAVNALCLGYVMYRSGLVPRIIPAIGLAGAPLLVISAAGTMFGLHAQASASAAVLALPIGLWELSLGLWLAFRGFRREPLTRLLAADNVAGTTSTVDNSSA